MDEIAREKKEGALKMFFGPRRGRRRLYVSIALILALIVLVGSLALLSYMAQRGAQNTSDMIATAQAINRSRNP